MASVNKVILIGNLGADPELRQTGAGQSVSTFNIATSEKWKDQSGSPQERTEWHRIVVWGKQAELCKEYLSKGRPVYIEGRLQTREWSDKEGHKRHTTEVVCQRMQFLGSSGGAQGGSRSTAPDTGMPGFDAPVDDDIPF